MTDDPFDRAVRREATLRQRAMSDNPDDFLGLIQWFFVAALALWAGILAVHWWLLPDPEWLRVLHAVVFMLGVGYFLVVGTAYRVMKRRHPSWFGAAEEPEIDLG